MRFRFSEISALVLVAIVQTDAFCPMPDLPSLSAMQSPWCTIAPSGRTPCIPRARSLFPTLCGLRMQRGSWGGGGYGRNGRGSDERRAKPSSGRRETGVAARWNAKGFGFIEPDDGGAVLFCHSREILDGKCLLPGSPVEFVRVWDDRRGKEEASEVTGGAPEEAHVFDSSRRGWAGTFDDEDREMDDAPPAGARESGVVDRWQERGFGFIRPDGGGPDVFCHAREIQDGDSLSPGNRVEFVRVWDRRRNKEEASQVTGGDGFGPNGARGAPPRAGRFAYRGGGGKAELAELMAAFYAIHRPEQVARVPELAPDFVGREQELCDMLFEKYGADLSSVQDAAAPVAQEGEWEED